MAWLDSTKSIDQKSLTDHEPKRHRRYDGTHVNIARFINSFRLMKATYRAQTTHNKALNDNLSISTAR